MKAVVAAFNQEKALVGAFSVIVQLHRTHTPFRMKEVQMWTWTPDITPDFRLGGDN